MHFPDLSVYVYGGSEPDGSVLNVGWLSRDHAFTTGETSSEFVEALRQLVARPVNLFRGFHKCEFCPDSPPHVVGGLRWNSNPPEVLGNGEIRVLANGVTYVAPVLVRHYVEFHRYKPPLAFVDACLDAMKALATPYNSWGQGPDLDTQVTYLATTDGGRRAPAETGYRAQHAFGLTGELHDAFHEYPDGGCVAPGATARALLWLHAPEGRFYPGLKFTVREGSKVVAHGEVTAVLNNALARDA